MKNYYEILDLDEGASKEEIREAYERLSKELDPKNNNDQEFFKEEYRKGQNSWLKNQTLLLKILIIIRKHQLKKFQETQF